jgi:RNA polymerase sigma factor (sigma-70 family)
VEFNTLQALPAQPSAPMAERAEDEAESPVDGAIDARGALAVGHMHFDLVVLRDPDGDPDAHQREWRRLVEHFVPRLNSYFRLKVPAPDERDDLVQHILFKAVLNVRGIHASAALWNWLRKIGENRVIDLQRSEQSTARHLEQQAAELEFASEAALSDGLVDLPLDSAEGEGELGRRVAALSALDRQLLTLVANDVPHETIAKQLGLPSAEASRQRWSRLRRKLRAL